MTPKKPTPLSLLAWLGLGLAVVCALAAALSGLGHRLGWWPFQAGFSILRWSAWGGLLTVAICIAGGLFSLRDASMRRTLAAALGIAIGFGVTGFPFAQIQIARRVPKIHDITTDTENPPRFVALLPLRKGAANPPGYEGPRVARLQKKFYTDIKPLLLDEPQPKVFAKALSAARAMGWRVVASTASQGRIEAWDKTFWYGFTDDVVIRIRPAGKKTRLDIRSKSRVGRSDIGANARRIRGFLARIR